MCTKRRNNMAMVPNGQWLYGKIITIWGENGGVHYGRYPLLYFSNYQFKYKAHTSRYQNKIDLLPTIPRC